MIDPATPQSAYSIVSREGPVWELVFSDEVSCVHLTCLVCSMLTVTFAPLQFNTDGRTFWPGDDPYWLVLLA